LVPFHSMSRVAPLGRLPSIDAKNSKDGRNKGSDSSAGAAEEDDGVLDGIKDHVLSIDDNFVELFFSSDLYLHMTTVMSALNLMILTVGLLSDRMLVGENTVEGGTEMASAGMWKVSYGTEGDTEEFALCSSINPDASGWPDETASPSFCRAVNASRAFFILAIAVDLFAVVCGLVSWIGGERYKSWADEQMFTYIASGFFGLIGWIVWMACVDKKMNTMLRDSMLDEAGARGNKLCMPSDEQGYTVGNCPTDSVYPYITLGYSYGFLAWAAIFPIMLILTKTTLPRLDVKHGDHENRVIWLCGYMFDSASNPNE